MQNFRLIIITALILLLQSCVEPDKIEQVNDANVGDGTSSTPNTAPVAVDLTPAAFNEDTQSVILLNYTDVDGDEATACTLSNLTNITMTQSCTCEEGVCSVGVKGTSHYNGAAGFEYTVIANSQSSNSAIATLTINAVADSPVASNVSPAAFNENTQSIITLAYTDPDSDLATSCTLSSLTNVTQTQACACAAGVCTVGVTGTLNYVGSASFVYTVTANGQASNNATALLTISNVDVAPVAAAISPAAFNEDTASTITLSYTDVDSDLATTCSISGLTNVTITQACACAAGVCTVGVKGTSNYNGAASFSYTVRANAQNSNSATATLTINAVDDAPVSAAITPAAFNENTQSVITLSYTDVDSDLATACTVSSLTNVTITQACACAAGVCTVGVTGTANYNGSASFAYTVTANGQTSNSSSASLTITNVDNAPVAANISPAAFNEDTQSVITLSYTDADSNLATTCSLAGLTNVTITQACACNGAGVCTVGVTGSPNYNGAASFTYTVTANGQASNSATVTLSITSVADAPVAANITPAAFNENAQSIITLSYSDGDSDLATSCSIASPTNVAVTQGCACAAGVCTVGVTGSTNYNGSASFAYTVTANAQVSNSATATLTITNVDNAPVAAAISPAAFNEDTQSVITLSYTDADSDQATACSLAALTNVTETQGCACAAGVCTVGVTGTANYHGAASFTFTVTANGQISNSANATLTINNLNDAPVAANITPAAFSEDTQSIITLSYSDIDSDLATACSIASLSNVTVTQACACAAGTCTVGVTGTAGYDGPASFAYTVTANSQVSNSATASLTITNVNSAPVATDITPAAFNEDTQSIITLSYTDADADLATACSLSSLGNVTVTQACACAAGVCTVGVTGAANYNGAASFDYTVTANAQVSNTATATFTINAVADAPVASNITPAAFNEDTQSIITLSYSDADSDQATACSVGSLTNVTETQACACAAGVCTVGVTGTANHTGAASFAYTVTANGDTSNSATASLTISNVNDAPVAINITPAAFDEDVASVITLSYTDADVDLATSCSTSNLSNITVTSACACVLGTCSVTVKGTANYNGVASFDYTVTANTQASNTATASLTISAVDDAPVASNINPASFEQDTQSVITLSYTDVESNPATACSVSSLTNVTATQACACAAGVCTVGVTGTASYTGSASFAYTVTANGLVSNSATASLTIDPTAASSTLVTLFPAQTVILPENADVGDTISDVSSQYSIFHDASPDYSIVTNTVDNNFSISAGGVLSVASMTNLTAGLSYNITVRAEDSTKLLYDEKTITINVIDDANIIHIDPNYAGVKTGSRTQPYATWTEAKTVMAINKYLLQKRGTETTLASFDFNVAGVSNVTMGAYGSGARPIINFTTASGRAIDTFGKDDLYIRDLHLKGTATSTASLINIEDGSSHVEVHNCKFEGASFALRIFNVDNIVIQNNEIMETLDDGMYTGFQTGYDGVFLDNLEIAYNYIHHVNQNYTGPGTTEAVAPGDGIQFNGLIRTLSVHHNIIDRSDTGNKFCIILSPRTHDVIGSFKYNYCKANNTVSSTTSNPVTGFYVENVLVAGENPIDLEIVGNKFIDVNYGLFLKDWSSIKVHSNQFIDNFIALRFGSGTGGEIYNNLFKDAQLYAILFGDTSTNFAVSKNNIFDISSSVRAYSGSLSRVSASNKNIFSHEAANFAFGYGSLAALQAAGSDADSIVASPVYADEAGGDYHQTAASPAKEFAEDLLLVKDIEEQDYSSNPHAGPYQLLK